MKRRTILQAGLLAALTPLLPLTGSAAPLPWRPTVAPDEPAADETGPELEARLRALGLADIREYDDSLLVELKYACAANFMGEDVYGGLTRCFLRPEAAERLAQANGALRAVRPDLRLLVVDGARPRRVQRRMWALVKGTPRQRYVANPDGGSMHNYGVAADLVLADAKGRRLDLGTPMDAFQELAQPALEKRFLRQGLLTAEQTANRQTLRQAMLAAGFTPLSIEWWHFDALDRDVARRRYSIIE